MLTGGHVLFFISVFCEFPRFTENLRWLYLTEISETLWLTVLQVGSSSLCSEVATQFYAGCITFASLEWYIRLFNREVTAPIFYLWRSMFSL